jgi:sugar lactone lactonase YvrE
VRAGAFIEISNTGFAGGIYGSLDLDFGILGNIRLLGVEASLRLNNSSISFTAGATFFGITLRRTFSFSFDSPESLGTLENGVLTLPGGNSGRTYEIEGAGGNDVIVRSGTDFNHFSGVEEIVFEGGRGDDTVTVLDSVTQKLTLDTGAGNDYLYIYGGSDESLIEAGEGNDLVIGGLANAHYRLGSGNDRFAGGSGSERVTASGGINIVNTGGGDDVIVLEAGRLEVEAGAGTDLVELSLTTPEALEIGDHHVKHGALEVLFDDSLEGVSVNGSPMAEVVNEQGYYARLLATGVASERGETLDGLLVDDAGNIYVSAPEDEYIYRISPDGTKTIFAGFDGGGASNNRATGDRLDVSFERQFGLAWNADKSVMYVADKDNDVIRQIDMATGVMSDFYDFPGFNRGNTVGVADMAVAEDGTVYAVIWSNTDGSIHRIEADGSRAEELVGELDGSWGVAYHDGHLYVAEKEDGRIVKFDTQGNRLGDVVSGYREPRDLAFDAEGRMVFADNGGVYRLNLNGTVETLYTGLGSDLRGVEVFGDSIFVADLTQNAVHELVYVAPNEAGQHVPTLVLDDSAIKRETVAVGIAEALGQTLDGALVDAEGNVYVSAPEDEFIYRISPDGEVTVFAGFDGGGASNNSATGDRLEVSFERQFGLAWNSDRTVMYVADKDNDGIRQIDMVTGEMSTFYDFVGFNHSNRIGPADLVVGPDGALYVTVWDDNDGSLWRVEADGSGRTELVDGLDGPWGLQLHEGTLYLAEQAAGRIVQYDLEGNYLRTVVKGLSDPRDLAFDAEGRMIFADAGTVYRMGPDGSLETLVDGLGDALRGIAIADDGAIYVVDADSNALHRLTETEGMQLGASGLRLTTEGLVDVRETPLVAPQGHFVIDADGVIGTLFTTVDSLSVITRGTEHADIIVIESDDLDIRNHSADARNAFDDDAVVTDQSVDNGGLYSVHGRIEVTVDGTFEHLSGLIAAPSVAQGIRIEATEASFAAGLKSIDFDQLELVSEVRNLSLFAPTEVLEGSVITYAVMLPGGASGNLEISLSNGAVISLEAGANSGLVKVPAPADNVVLDNRSAAVRITGVSGDGASDFRLPAEAVVTRVNDTENPTTVTLSGPKYVTEGIPLVYTITLSNPVAARDIVVVRLSNGMTLELQPGQTTATAEELVPFSEDIENGFRSVEIVSVSSQRFEAVNLVDLPVETTVLDRTKLSPDDVALLQVISRSSAGSGEGTVTIGEEQGENEDSDEDSDGDAVGSGTASGSGVFGSTNFAGDPMDGSDSASGDSGDGINVEMDVFEEEVYL